MRRVKAAVQHRNFFGGVAGGGLMTSMSNCLGSWTRHVRKLVAALISLALVSAAHAQTNFNEVEGASGNSTKANANIVPFGMVAGDTITGLTTGTTTGNLTTSYDYFRLHTATLPSAIYLHRLTITTTATGTHVGSIRALTQVNGAVSGGTDDQAQASSTVTTPPK